jgi:dTDP-4-amino-4,6-dideoxygalactose transaminase
MNNSKIWLSSPHLGGTEYAFVQDAFSSNWIAPLGPNVDGFELDLEKYLGESVSVGALSAGTAAIHLGLILLGVSKNDEVLVQTHTHNASVNPIIYLGATPIFIDSELDTFNLCPEILEQAIVDRIKKGKKPKAIIAVHLYGMPYKIEAIRSVADKYEIPILEDSAEALGSNFKGQKCGTFGDIGILSFNGNKIITTSGGGAIVTKTKALKEKALFFATQARDVAPHFQHSEIGYNYRLSNICAGIGRGQMQVVDAHIEKRRAIHDFYVILFKNIEGVNVSEVPNADYYSNYWLTTIQIDPKITRGITRETLRLALDSENIESRPFWKPMHMQPVFEKFPYYGTQIAASLFENGLCLPSGSNLTEEEKNRISFVVKKIFSKQSV